MAGRVIRLKELISRTGLSRSAIYDRLDAKSPRHDPTFPRSFSLGGAAVGWYLEEVDRWLQGCAEPGQRQVVVQPALGVAPARPARNEKPSPVPNAARPSDSDDPATATSLAEALVAGSLINAKLLGYLRMDAWSPVMAALLVSGVEPPPDCVEIPLGGTGLEGKSLHASSGRFHSARRALKAWSDVDEDDGEVPRRSSVPPLEFLAWCHEEDQGEGDWLRYLIELAGMKELSAPDLSAPRLDLAFRRTKLQ